MIFYKYATIQSTDGGVFVFMDNQVEVPTMNHCTWLRQFDVDGRDAAFDFAIKWVLIKVSELQIVASGKRRVSLLYVKDPDDRTRPYSTPQW